MFAGYVQQQYALKENFVKIEFEKSFKRLSILCRLLDIKIAWLNICQGMLHHVCDLDCDENMRGPIRTCKCRSIN